MSYMFVQCAGEYVSCVLQIVNTGNMELSNVTVEGQPGCSTLPSLAPMSETSCTVGWQLTQQDLDTWDRAFAYMRQGVFTRDVIVIAAGGSSGMLQAADWSSVEIPLVSQPAMVVTNVSVRFPTMACDPMYPQATLCYGSNQGQNLSRYAVLPGTWRLVSHLHTVLATQPWGAW
jgi:hypothetical protein